MSAPPFEDGLVLEALTVEDRRLTACEDLSLRVPAGVIYGLLARSGAGVSSLFAAVAGERKPASGRVLVCGTDAWRQRRAARKLVARAAPDSRSRITPVDLVEAALTRSPRVLLLNGIDLGGEASAGPTIRGKLREAAARGAAVLLATSHAADAEGLADRIGILRSGKLALEDDAAALARRFRKIRYRNEVTNTRTEYGTELDLFEAVRVRVRGWGVEAVVSNFSDDLFDRLRASDGIMDAEASVMTLSEIFDAVAP
ncbi:MAG TPA: ATP-binding cassette domain-containing protein [Thermoanaerobaculia bacterium]|nr:ATP-binding cassette domain-containing protein [Thermoanaerobaculia bacterium]